ncbi:XRE family transcriptional regulator [Streptomyces sp. NPDC058864]
MEHGVTPSLPSQLQLAQVLQVPEADVHALGWPGWLPAYSQTLSFTPADSRIALREATVARTDRRAFLVMTAAAVAGVAQQWAATEPGRLTSALGGQRVDGQLVVWLEQRCADLRALTAVSGEQLRTVVDAHLDTAIDLIDRATYTETAGTRLHAAAAQLALTSGWLRFDQASHGAAQRLWHMALHAAHVADDRDLGAAVLSDLAYQATWLHQPAQAVEILDHARRRTHSPAARSLLDLRRARALAALADPTRCQRALAAAESELDHAAPGTTPPWIAWMSPADLAVDAGRALLDLGKPQRAADALESGLRQLDPARARTRAVFQTYQAEGALADHDLDAAVSHARHALDTALNTGAARCRGLVTSLLPRLEAHRTSHREVTAFVDEAHSRLASVA